MTNKSWRRGLVALAVSAALGMSSGITLAADGGIVGSVSGVQATGYVVTVKNPATGFAREIPVDSNGAFRIPQLPSGQYEIEVSKDGKVEGRQTVSVGIGGNAVARFDLAARGGAEVIEVVGARPSAVDLTSTDSGLIIGSSELEKMPVARSLTSVALLAPGVVKGEVGWGDLASFGGASVAENSCYINGVNVTNTRTGLGCGTVPFSFYKEFQVKTGGYSAQFGRTTGGVINTVTKSGTNEWQFEGNVFYEPSALREHGQVSYGNNGRVFRDFSSDDQDNLEFDISAAGPIIKDKLFVYAILNPRSNKQEGIVGGTRSTVADLYQESSASGGDNMFWGIKLDWQISDDHRLEVFGYSDERTTHFKAWDLNPDTRVQAPKQIDDSLQERGGTTKSIRYVGAFGDLTVSAMMAEVEHNFENRPSVLSCPGIADLRAVSWADSARRRRCADSATFGTNYDVNKPSRIDFEWALGDHMLRFGYDHEERGSFASSFRTGVSGPNARDGGDYTYRTLANGGRIAGIGYTNTTGAAFDYVGFRQFNGGGEFESIDTALYIEDEWQVNERLTLNLGLRSDSFENKTVTGSTLVEDSNLIAPRLGVAFDMAGDGSSKLFANVGQYYLPIANNTTFRAASGVRDTTKYFRFNGIDPASGRPLNQEQLIGTRSEQVNSSGSIPAHRLFQPEDLDPYYQNEFLIGYQQELTENLSATVRAVYRDTASTIDDYCGVEAPAGHDASGDSCILINPGKGATYSWDINQDGVPDGPAVFHSAEDIGLPEAERTYKALQFEFDYRSATLRLSAGYTWSRNEGNFEGAVKSDILQQDFGITQDFDFPALTDGAYGRLPNDREHVFKFFGSYSVTDAFSVGFNAQLKSGRPYSAFGGGYPEARGELYEYGGYGDTYWIRTGCPDTNANGRCDPAEKQWAFVPRGKAGVTPWTLQLDANMAYSFNLGGLDLRATLDIFNILNTQEVLQVSEFAEPSRTEGVPNIYFRTPTAYQVPRYVRFGLEARF